MPGGMEITMTGTVVTAAKRRHTVARPPATVIGTVGFIVIDPDTHAAGVSATRYAAGRQERGQPDHQGDR
jgi:hypothetical protein